MAKSKFQHLPLPALRQGPARLGKPPHSADQTKKNRKEFANHGNTIKRQVVGAVKNIQKRLASRTETAPQLPAGAPLTIQVDPQSFDIDKLRQKFDFEVVLEDEDGFVIVACEDLNLTKLQAMVDAYTTDTYGSATIASIYSVDDNEGQVERLRRILAQRLFAIWSKIATINPLIVDVSVNCEGTAQIDPEPNRGKTDTDRSWSDKLAQWHLQKSQAYQIWDDLKDVREEQLRKFVEQHKGEILRIIDNVAYDAAYLPDSFSVRVSISGDGLRDLVLNYPYIFEVVEPDEIELPQNGQIDDPNDDGDDSIMAPSSDAPKVCVIDSGIQEAHRLLRDAIDTENSHSYLPNDPSVMDTVANGGHGTRVAGVALYGESIPEDGAYQADFWVQNARVLDEFNGMPTRVYPPLLMEAIVARFHGGVGQTRIFNQSINSRTPCRRRHMSAWAAAIDRLSFDKDILFIQSAGNIHIESGQTHNPGVVEHLNAGRVYPEFLYENSFRVANPAHSFQALTVGSV